MKKKSNFTPAAGRDRWLDTYLEVVKEDIIRGLKTTTKNNLTKDEENAMRELLMDDSIVIRPADKGSGVVVIDTVDYTKQLIHEVQDSDTYTRVNEDLTKQINTKVRKLVNRMYKEGSINSDVRHYLLPSTVQPGQLKGNPKIHKSGNPLRTIVSGIGTPTEKIAEVAEKELNEYVVNSPSYIRDTTDFINQIKDINGLPDDTILFCFDVCKLYPSIPKKEGMDACEEAVAARSSKGIPDSDVISMITLVLDNNNFQFNGQHFLQVDGTAIGSRLGKNYACTYMRKWDEQLLAHEILPRFYKRFIDDGIGIWTEGEEELMKFANHANNIHPRIKVTLRWSREKIEFLDTWLKLQDGKLQTDLYSKPTDKHLYLQPESDHPDHTKTAIPYGLGLRLKRICSEESSFQQQSAVLKTRLQKRGYGSKVINNEFRKVNRVSREEALKKTKKKEAKNRVPLVLTYSSHLPDIHHIIHNRTHLLHKSKRMADVFKEPPLVAYRRGQNLGDVLIHGKFNRIFGAKGRNNNAPCGEPKCTICPYFDPADSFTSVNGVKYKITRGGTCNTRNVVYLLSCKVCHCSQYVGETERSLKERAKEHIWDIRACRDKPVSNHFNLPAHSIHDLSVQIIEKVTDKTTSYRRVREEFWIAKIGTTAPNGLNVKTS
ncbi:MAG: GIY-YIG nuclease family protein [Sedimenticola sp.]